MSLPGDLEWRSAHDVGVCDGCRCAIKIGEIYLTGIQSCCGSCFGSLCADCVRAAAEAVPQAQATIGEEPRKCQASPQLKLDLAALRASIGLPREPPKFSQTPEPLSSITRYPSDLSTPAKKPDDRIDAEELRRMLPELEQISALLERFRGGIGLPPRVPFVDLPSGPCAEDDDGA